MKPKVSRTPSIICKLIVKCCILSLLFLFKGAAAQQVKMSEKIQVSGKDNQFGVIGKYKNRYFTYNAGKDIQVYVYDTSMRLHNKVKLEFIPDNYRKIDFLSTNNGILVIYQYYEEQTIVVKGVVLDQEANLSEFPKDILSAEIYNPNSVNSFEISYSEDKKRILLYALEKIKAEAKLHIAILDNEMNLNDSVSYSIAAKLNDVELDINNNSVVCGLMSKKNNYESYAEMNVFLYNKLKNVLKAVPIDIANFIFFNKKIAINNFSNQFHLFAYMHTSGDAQSNLLLHKVFDLNSSDEISSNNIVLKNEKLPKNNYYFDFVPLQIMFTNNGSCVILSERQKTSDIILNRNPTTFGGRDNIIDFQQKTTQYHYDDIHVLILNKLDGIESDSYIPKEQISDDDDALYSSYGFLKRSRNLSAIYNSVDRKNKVFMADINPDGSYVVRELFIPEAKEQYLVLKQMVQVSVKDALVPCFTKGSLSFALFSLN